MSVTGSRLNLNQADSIAARLLSSIEGEAHVVGSVRRRRETVGDIELLVHVDAKVRLSVGLGLFDSEFENVKGGNGEWRFWQIHHAELGYVVDLYRFNDLNRGSLMLIRTGPAAFSQRFVIALRSQGYHHEHGHVRPANSLKIVPCETEELAFKLAGMHYIKPEER